ncbi:MAG: hypothetical protein ACLFWM_03285, partial [Actinomycetota bacterium]
VILTASPVRLQPGEELAGRRVLVIEDGPTLTHGGMPFGAGTVAARQAGARIVDPRPHAVGSIRRTLERHPHLGPLLPAMGYGEAQLAELEETIRRVPCDVVVAGTPIDLGRVIDLPRPIRRATYESVELGEPKLAALVHQAVAGASSRSVPAPAPIWAGWEAGV